MEAEAPLWESVCIWFCFWVSFLTDDQKDRGEGKEINDQKIASVDGIEMKGCYYAAFCKQII